MFYYDRKKDDGVWFDRQNIHCYINNYIHKFYTQLTPLFLSYSI